MFRIRDSASNNFDFIRLFLSVLVIFSHSYSITLGAMAGHEPISILTHGYVNGGILAVDSFFLISGYLVTSSFVRSRTTGSYFKKRVARIYPGFIGATLFNLLIVGPLAAGHLRGATHLSRAGLAILRALTLRDLEWTGVFAANPQAGVVDGSMWTIHYEFLCYIMLAILALCGILRSRRTCMILFLLVLVSNTGLLLYIQNWNPAMHDGVAQRSSRFATLFLAGAVAYLFREELQFRSAWAVAALLALCAVAIVPDVFACIFPLAGTYLVLFLSFYPVRGLKHFARYGDFSYGTYLYAFPIQQLVEVHFKGQIGPLKLFCIAAPLTLIAGALSWFLIERWFLSRSRLQH
jgi:peptidoglycan/LPS O-acetylase OafA/YrhL